MKLRFQFDLARILLFWRIHSFSMVLSVALSRLGYIVAEQITIGWRTFHYQEFLLFYCSLLLLRNSLGIYHVINTPFVLPEFTCSKRHGLEFGLRTWDIITGTASASDTEWLLRAT